MMLKYGLFTGLNLWLLAVLWLGYFAIFPVDAHAQVLNRGISGNTTADLLGRVDADVISEHPDLVILMAGTNDLLNTAKMVSYCEYAQNLSQLVEKIKSAGSQVLLMSPPPVDTAYLFTRHDRRLYPDPPNDMLDSARNIVRQVAGNHKVLFLDLYQKLVDLGIPRHNEDLFIRSQYNSGVSDGVHFTALGYHFIAEYVYLFLAKNALKSMKSKIVCFGDSITKGVGVEEDQSYPSYLFRRIKNDRIE